ncbi:ssp-35 [Pristionchus pacificus]|uniref:Ssp-35 n=1 Tax=Pristionchus pacificus TaxID=54126 RepID=A0A454XSE7_PRIPA|nr:ssp-35 [Pristionchus pacificus]|eukprot:PDM83913.1 ssp-35 [Pristionchus pacificus]
MTLNIDPPETSFHAGGGNVTVKIVSTSESKLAFKVKSSNNECYRVKPVFGFIEPKADSPLEIMRIAGPPKDDKLVVQWAEVPPEETDPKAPFAAQAQQGEVILPLKAA